MFLLIRSASCELDGLDMTHLNVKEWTESVRHSDCYASAVGTLQTEVEASPVARRDSAQSATLRALNPWA